jgi:nucleoside-diphosphate-sugar epimerase
MDTPPHTSLITGGTGFLGSLVAAALLSEERRRLLLPIRTLTAMDHCLAHIRLGLRDRAVPEQLADELMRLVTVVELPALDRLSDLDEVAIAMHVDEVVHCAGCVDYFDKERLQLANVELTSQLLDVTQSWDVRRFIYLSTAYCAGYRSGSIPECLHSNPAPADEPTEYTRTKRIAEWKVAESGIPFVIVRPSVVIGDSCTGIYRGKNYGLYQLWRALEGFLCREYAPIWYWVAPPVPLNFVHQDAFQAAFISIYRHIVSNTIVHLVSDHAKSPTLRELCWMWADVYGPEEIHSYAHIDDVPLQALPVRHRRFLQVVAKNLEIATHTWNFEAGHLDRLRSAGLAFTDTTVETVARCQRRYIAGSPRIQEHIQRYAGRPSQQTRFIEMST